MAAIVLKYWVRSLLGLVITGFFLWLLLRQIDLTTVGAVISGISLLSFLVALGFLAAGYTVRIVRWWWMLRILDPHVRLGACGWPFLVSIAVNNLLPFRAGDALRVIGFREQLRSPAMRLLGTLFIERLLDLMTLLAFFFFGLMGISSGKVPESLIQLSTWMVAAALATVLTILLFAKQIEQLVHWIAELSYLKRRGWTDPIKRHGSHFFHALSLLRAPIFTLQLVILSVVVWGFEGAVFVTVAQALSVESASTGPWFALATGTLATLLPSSPGYIGTFDYFTTLGLIAYGAEPTTATAFAVAVHVVLWLPLTVGGLIYFIRPSAYRLRRQVVASITTKGETL
jgi:uncharacterized protein (TIRG00374 family)